MSTKLAWTLERALEEVGPVRGVDCLEVELRIRSYTQDVALRIILDRIQSEDRNVSAFRLDNNTLRIFVLPDAPERSSCGKVIRFRPGKLGRLDSTQADVGR